MADGTSTSVCIVHLMSWLLARGLSRQTAYHYTARGESCRVGP